MEAIKHLLTEAVVNFLQWGAVYAAGVMIPFAVSALKRAKKKTESETMAEIYSIADTIITNMQPIVNDMKKDGRFTKQEAATIKSAAVKEIKKELRKHQNKLILKVAKDSGLVNHTLMKLVETVIDNKKSKIVPRHFSGVRFNWKF